jgi:hypothetical protein
MSSRYVRTPAGQVEIQARAHQLSRPVRNLLLVINDSRTIDEWLASVNGVAAADVGMLKDLGFIAEAGGPAAAKPSRPGDLREGAAKPAPGPARAAPAPAPAGAGDHGADWQRTQDVVRAASYTALYDALNSVGKAKLGLVKGYRFALEVEKCSGPDEIRALALKFAEQLRNEHGMAAVGEFTYAIGAAVKA